MVYPPCKKNGVQCTKRYIGCHDNCPDWHKYTEAKNKEREASKKKKKEDYDVLASRQNSLRKIRNRSGITNYRK